MLPIGATHLQQRGAVKKQGSHTDTIPTAKTGPENTFAIYHHQNKCHLHHVMLPGILTASASFWI